MGTDVSLASAASDGIDISDRLRTVLELTRSFTFLVDLGPDGSVEADQVSDQLTRDLGYTVEDLRALGGALAIVHPEDLPKAVAMIDALVVGEQPRLELRAVAKDGSVRWLQVYCTTTRPDVVGAVRVFGVGQDVTEQVEARKALEESTARFRAMFEHAPFGLLVVSPDQEIRAVNPAFHRITGYSEEEVVGQHVSVVVDPAFLGEAQKRFDRKVSVTDAERLEYESLWRTKDGRQIDVEMTVVPERDEEGNIRQYMTTVQDVTERKRAKADAEQARAERLTLLERLVEAHVEERVRIARELHDGLGQVLTSASLFAISIEERAPAPLAPGLSTLRSQLDEALAATRDLVWRLRPVEMDEAGLADAVVTMAEKIRHRHHIDVDLHISGLDDRLAPRLEAAIYRVVQEAVMNSVKHADPEAISIVITRRGSAIVAVIEDDGAGFDVESVSGRDDEAGFGIVGMRERAASFGGQLAIESRPGNGVMVRLEVPCTAAESS
jgi:PAS domain S-box-containing protein